VEHPGAEVFAVIDPNQIRPAEVPLIEQPLAKRREDRRAVSRIGQRPTGDAPGSPVKPRAEPGAYELAAAGGSGGVNIGTLTAPQIDVNEATTQLASKLQPVLRDGINNALRQFEGSISAAQILGGMGGG
jgi:hypothetical protein